MPRKGTGEYPPNWKQIAQDLKCRHDWKCERCGEAHNRRTGHVLTVHHLDGDKGNCADWNLACLCQRRHLHIQAKVVMSRPYFFEHSEWFKPHVAGYEAAIRRKNV